MKRLAIAAAALASLAVLAATLRTGAAAAVEPDASGGITVQGSATESGAPTKAALSLGVESRAATAKDALAANGAAMRKVLAAIRDAGGKDLRTQSVWVSSIYGQKGPQGYTATNTVTTTIEVGKAGALIDAAVAAGANQVSGPSMSAADQEALYRKALEEAVADARARAEALAKASGVALGRVTAIVEGGGSSPMPMAMAAKAADASTPIEPGTQDVTAQVTVTFAIS